MYRSAFTWAALSLAVLLPDRAEAGCRGRGRLFHRGGCQVQHNLGSCAQVPTVCCPAQSSNCVGGSCAPVTGQPAQPPRVRLFNGGRCGPNGCS